MGTARPTTSIATTSKLPTASQEAEALGVPAAGSGGVRISWAWLDEEMVNIRNIPSEGLSRCKCLVCNNAVVARRGTKRKWHFAHTPGAPPCPLHSEEMLKRFEAMMRIHSALKDLEQLTVLVTCRTRKGVRANHLVVAHDWVAGWDTVEVNFEANDLRPDLLLLREDQPVAAIEVRGSNPVGASKEQMLGKIGVLWAEVGVDSALQWERSGPLNIYRLEPQGWLCPTCSAREKTSKNRPPQCEVHEARLAELREQGLLRPLWEQSYRASHQGRGWSLDLQICDLIDARGLPLHRLMIDMEYGYVIVGVTVEELASDEGDARRQFKEGRESWIASLEAVGVQVTEVNSGWNTVGEPDLLYDTDEARRRLRQLLQELVEDPAVVRARQVLEVESTCTIQDLKAARRGLARAWHPDLASPERAETLNAKMAEINAAFDLLTALCTRPKQ